VLEAISCDSLFCEMHHIVPQIEHRMREYGHSHLTLLKLDAGGLEFLLLPRLLHASPRAHWPKQITWTMHLRPHRALASSRVQPIDLVSQDGAAADTGTGTSTGTDADSGTGSGISAQRTGGGKNRPDSSASSATSEVVVDALWFMRGARRNAAVAALKLLLLLNEAGYRMIAREQKASDADAAHGGGAAPCWEFVHVLMPSTQTPGTGAAEEEEELLAKQAAAFVHQPAKRKGATAAEKRKEREAEWDQHGMRHLPFGMQAWLTPRRVPPPSTRPPPRQKQKHTASASASAAASKSSTSAHLQNKKEKKKVAVQLAIAKRARVEIADDSEPLFGAALESAALRNRNDAAVLDSDAAASAVTGNRASRDPANGAGGDAAADGTTVGAVAGMARRRKSSGDRSVDVAIAAAAAEDAFERAAARSDQLGAMGGAGTGTGTDEDVPLNSARQNGPSIQTLAHRESETSSASLSPDASAATTAATAPAADTVTLAQSDSRRHAADSTVAQQRLQRQRERQRERQRRRAARRAERARVLRERIAAAAAAERERLRREALDPTEAEAAVAPAVDAA
jgi:hypothetical protein